MDDYRRAEKAEIELNKSLHTGGLCPVALKQSLNLRSNFYTRTHFN